MNPGESYDPFLMSPVKSTSISVDESGKRQVKEGFFAIETIETWIVYVCHSEGELARQNKRLKCLWIGYGSRCQVHRFECVKNCNTAGFFMLNSFPCESRMVHHPKDIQPIWHNCGKHWESTWASIPVERFQHLYKQCSLNCFLSHWANFKSAER